MFNIVGKHLKGPEKNYTWLNFNNKLKCSSLNIYWCYVKQLSPSVCGRVLWVSYKVHVHVYI